MHIESDQIFFQALLQRFEQAYAAVPAENRVVVSRRADLLRLIEVREGAVKKRQQRVRRLARVKLRLRAAFV